MPQPSLETDMIDLVKLLPNGAAVVAVIIVVMLFLKQQDKMNEVLQQITDKFNEQSAANQKAFQEQINKLAEHSYTNQRAFQDQIQSLIDAHMRISTQTITALKALEATVREVKDKVSGLKG